MKNYENPEIEVARVELSDVITTSGGTETSIMPEGDIIWDFNISTP